MPTCVCVWGGVGGWGGGGLTWAARRLRAVGAAVRLLWGISIRLECTVPQPQGKVEIRAEWSIAECRDAAETEVSCPFFTIVSFAG